MKVYLFLLMIFLTHFSFAQTILSNSVLIEKKAIEADYIIGYDKFEYLYSVKSNVLFKTKNGESLEYKNLALGQITKVDIQNPLKVMVFYERFNTVVTLDNQLNETLKIDFSKLKTPLVVSKIGIALQNQMWVLDAISQQIFLYDSSNGALKSVGIPISHDIIFYNTDFNYFEWLDDNNDWYECSIFGKIRKLEYPIEFDAVLFSNSEIIIYQFNQKIRIFNRKTQKNSLLENSDKTFESLSFKNQILTIFTKQVISNYKITLP